MIDLGPTINTSFGLEFDIPNVTMEDIVANEWTDWIAHDGGTCPIPDAKAGEYAVQYRGGSTEVALIEAILESWGHLVLDPSGDIVAYRTRKEQP